MGRSPKHASSLGVTFWSTRRISTRRSASPREFQVPGKARWKYGLCWRLQVYRRNVNWREWPIVHSNKEALKVTKRKTSRSIPENIMAHSPSDQTMVFFVHL